MLLLHSDYCCSLQFVFRKREEDKSDLGSPCVRVDPQRCKAASAPLAHQWNWCFFKCCSIFATYIQAQTACNFKAGTWKSCFS